MFSQIWTKLKEVLRKMIKPKNIEEVLSVMPAISSDMVDRIELWGDMYENHAPWLHEATFDNPVTVKSLGLPQLIASEKARTALLEFQSEITSPLREVINDDRSKIYNPKNLVPNVEHKNNARAEYLNKQYKKLKRQLRRQLEYGIAKGGLVIKPYVVFNTPQTSEDVGKGTKVLDASKLDKANLEFDFVQADAFFPLSFDGSGNVTEAAFIQRKISQELVYSRLEYHKYENNVATIINKAYESSDKEMQYNSTSLGREVPLSKVPEWADLEPKTVIVNVDRPLFAYFRMPEANTVDTRSPLGVSGFDKAVDLIKDADMQYSRLLWEFEGSELAVDIDRNALKPETIIDDNGDVRVVSTPGILQQRLFRKLDLGDDDTYNVFAPQIRDESILNGLNAILMHIEDVSGLSRGTISDATNEARTATELKILKQRSFQSNAEIQAALQTTLEDVVYIADVYCTLYELTPPGEYEVSFEWDDSILVDVESELGKRITLLNNGLDGKVETRMWYHGETESQAREALLKIQEENRAAVEENLATQRLIGEELETEYNTASYINQTNGLSEKTKQKNEDDDLRDDLREKQPNGRPKNIGGNN